MAMFSVGIMADSLHLPFAQSLSKCRELGADGVQLYAVEGEMAPEEQTPDKLAQKRRLLADNGLEVSALCGDLGGHGFARAQENPEKIERSKRIVDLALELNSHVVTTHIGVIPTNEQSDVYKIMQEASHAAPDGAGDIPCRADGLDENGIDTHAHHNEKRLKRQREQRF